MTNENEHERLEMEKLRLERFKVWGRIITAAITVLFGSALVAYINFSFQKRQLDQQMVISKAELDLQDAKARAERRQAEMKYLGEFLTYALTDDIKKRIRFAEYFSTLTISVDLQDKWKVYHTKLVALEPEIQKRKKELAEAQKAGENEKVKELITEVLQLRAQTKALPKKTDVYITGKEIKRLLDKDWKPRNYTNNEFEEQHDGKVFYDKARGLMWQQSGSDNRMDLDDAMAYVDKLNLERFAGYSDWRIPTLEEAITLLEPTKNNDGLYIDQVFDRRQKWIWTSDLDSASRAWVVSFSNGGCGYGDFYYGSYVRAVR